MNAHDWPGNVRELENRLKRAVVMAERRLIDAADLELAPPVEERCRTSISAPPACGQSAMSSRKRWLRSNNTLSVAARLLGVSRPTLYGLMEAHGFATDAVRSGAIVAPASCRSETLPKRLRVKSCDTGLSAGS